MAKEKPGIPKGTRDFGPEVMNKRNYILETISGVFRSYGFKQIETPSLENLSVLTGKYGDEGEQLLFKVLNSGDYLQDVSTTDLDKGYKTLLNKISNKGLRYDLTVPLARFVVMNRNEITFPFKRFQIQPVWRADKPQKGRYREFLQCDADIIGTASLLCEVEMVQMMAEVMSRLDITDFKIRMNHRQILTSLAKLFGPEDKENLFAMTIDKLDKIGWKGVSKNLEKIGFTKDSIVALRDIFEAKSDRVELNAKLPALLDSKGNAGLHDINKVFKMLENSGWEQNDPRLQFDPALARGLSYYTGITFEVEIAGVNVGSVSGGGRYDDLTGIFGLPEVPATGFSFGIDRLYDALEELQKFPASVVAGTSVLIIHFDEASFNYGLQVLGKLRASKKLSHTGISIEMYPDLAKVNKQLSYANKNNISHVLLIGPDEIHSGKLGLKDMVTGNQQSLSVSQVIQFLQSL